MGHVTGEDLIHQAERSKERSEEAEICYVFNLRVQLQPFGLTVIGLPTLPTTLTLRSLLIFSVQWGGRARSLLSRNDLCPRIDSPYSDPFTKRNAFARLSLVALLIHTHTCLLLLLVYYYHQRTYASTCIHRRLWTCTWQFMDV